MKRLIQIAFFSLPFLAMGQQSITDKLTASIRNGGTGVAYFAMNYTIGNYQTKENDAIAINADDTSNIVFTARIGIADTGKAALDSNFVLTSSQVSLLNGFYQSASGNSNPDPNVSTAKNGASGTLTVKLCCGNSTDITYNTSIHISLGRYLLSYWTNWN